MQYFNPNMLYAKTGTTADSKEADKFKNLLGKMDPKVDREVRELLITARVGAVA